MNQLLSVSVPWLIAAGLIALVVWIASMVSFGKRRPTLTRGLLAVTCSAFALALAAFWLAATTSGATPI